MKTVSEILNDINIKSKQLGVEVSLFGETLADIIISAINGKSPNKIQLFVNNSKLFDEKQFQCFNNSKIEFVFGKTAPKSPFTINNGIISLDNFLSGSIDCITPVTTKKDIIKNTIKFTREAKENIEKTPYDMLEAILLSQKDDLFLDSQTIDFIFKNKIHIHNIPKRKVQSFFKDILKTTKIRKAVANFNTLGLSKEFFGTNLVETSYLNHLNENDFYEFLYLIFNNIDPEQIEEFLVEKLAIPLRDTNLVKNLSVAISKIEGESELDARLFLVNLNSMLRISNVCRLLRIMGFKELAKNVRSQKNSPITKDKICVNENIISAAFGIDDSKLLEEILSIAVNKIIEDPEFNVQHKILSYLNKERGSLWQEKKAAQN